MDHLPRELILEVARLLGLGQDSTDSTHFAHCSKRLHSILEPEIHIRRKSHFIQLVNRPSPLHLTLCAEDFDVIYGDHFAPLEDTVDLESPFGSISMTIGLGDLSHRDGRAVLAFLTRCKGLGYIDLTISRLDTPQCTIDPVRSCQGRICGFRLVKAIILACTEVANVELSLKLGQGVEKDEEDSPFEFRPPPIVPTLAVIPPTPLTSPQAKSPKHVSLQAHSLMDSSIFQPKPMKRRLSSPNPPTPSLQEAPVNGFRSFTLYQHPKVRVRSTSTMSQMPLEAAIRNKLRHAPYPIHCQPALKCFSLTNPRLFQASMYDLTLDILSSSTLTCLTLDLIPFSILIWSQIFAAISLPSLFELHIGKVEVAWPDLEAFFQRHESIKVLDLRGNLLVGRAALPESKNRETDGVKPLFPRVETLKANTEYLAPLLKDPFHLPFLHQLEICPTMSSYPGDPYSLQVFDAVLSRNQADSFYFSVIKELNLGYVRDSSFLEWAFQPYLKKPKAKGEGKRRLPQLKGVENVIYCGPPTFTKEVVDAVCAWLMDDGITPARTLNTHSRGELIIRLLNRVCPDLNASDEKDGAD
ncbi:hypothetical protein BJ165DRAFT_1476497 [Panaeolus papilionaceus]|nr:hypothetical protein BJ165DRAFT_1476497 [Panaeolus papilionaceus]